MVLHSVTGSEWRDYFNQARDRSFKYFFAAETWSSCPSYLEDQLVAIASTVPKLPKMSSSEQNETSQNVTKQNVTEQSVTNDLAMVDGSASLSLNFVLIFFFACYTVWVA